jgi:hypothetical protein
MIINRRDLLLLGGSSLIVLPTLTHATIPPPPSSAWYLIFIADGIYKISGLYIVDLPASFGTCRAYDSIDVSTAVRNLFTFTGPNGVSPFQMLIGAPSSDWWEVLDRRNGRIFRIWRYDRFEVRFSDGSRVKVKFNGRDASTLFWPLAGTERLPDGTRLDGRTGVYRPAGGDKGRDGDRQYVTSVSPLRSNTLWSHSTQVTPW